jgi:hypothetical protein
VLREVRAAAADVRDRDRVAAAKLLVERGDRVAIARQRWTCPEISAWQERKIGWPGVR